MIRSLASSILLTAALAGTAQAAITITYSTTVAPTYENLITFDEPTTPQGTIPTTHFASMGITMDSGVGGGPFVGPGAAFGGPALGADNQWVGAAFGAFMTFDSPITHFSAQWHDSSGAANFMGGGARIFAFLDGVQVADLFINVPTRPTNVTGPSWINIVGTDGMVFDDVRLLGFGNPSPTGYVDDISWTVPAPSAGMLLGLGGLAASRRRRAR